MSQIKTTRFANPQDEIIPEFKLKNNTLPIYWTKNEPIAFKEKPNQPKNALFPLINLMS